ncbi:MAG TPA: hypothetical protein VLG68_01475 [Gammaproteobacteria bacterium]|nr:hypothetical protein [Gammaproteobacteria bacterium]
MRRVLTACLAFALAALATGAELPLDVQATPVVEHGHLALRFVLENVSSADVNLNNADLPWGSPQSVKVSVKPKGSGKELSQLPVMSPPALGQTVLRPQQTLIGDYEIVIYGASLDALLDKGDLQVDWSYAPQAADGTSLGAYSGKVDVRSPLHR